MSILVDTGAWYAIVDTSDRHHKKAKRFYIDQAPKAPFITTDLILAETWTLINPISADPLPEPSGEP